MKNNLSNKLKNHFSVRTVSLKTNSHIPYSNFAFTPSTPLKGFTIVELLVVIVVIGILAAITIVSYTGISQKAVLASLQSDLSNSSQKLKMYQVEHGAYPAALDGSNCPKDSTGAVDTHYCLKASPGNRFVYGSSSPYSTFSLTATNDNGISYQVSDNSQPTVLAAAPTVSGSSPVADWLSTTQGDHYGNYYDLVSHNWATVTRTGPKTIYDPNANHIYDVPANYLAMNPWSAYQASGRGSAAVIEEARTNYVLNSYGAANSAGVRTGWGITETLSGAPTPTIVAGVYGATAQRIQYTGVAGDSSTELLFEQFTPNGSFAVGESVTFSCWAKATNAGVESWIQVVAYGSDGSYKGHVETQVTLTGTFSRFTQTYSSLPTGTDHLRVDMKVGSVDSGDSIDLTFDAAQLEKGAFATSYIPTTTAAVTRSKDVVTVPTTGWNAAAGTIVAVADVFDNAVLYRSVVDATSGSNWLQMEVKYGLGSSRAGNSGDILNMSGHLSGPYVLAMQWDGPGVISYVSGNASTPSGSITPPSTMASFAHIGSDANSNWNGNMSIQRVTVYSSALSSSDVTTVTNAVKNGP